MMNQQLVDYIKQQLAAGVSKDAVNKALADAGWPAADVADSMKAAEPAAAAGAAVASPTQTTINPSVAMGGVDPGPKASVATKPVSTPSSSDKFFSKPAATVAADDDDENPPSTKKFMVALIAMGAVIVLLGGALAFVYFNLTSQLTAAEKAGGGSAGQLAALQSQVAQLSKDKADLMAQIQPLSAENQQLAAELSFFAVAGSGATSTSATVTGTLSGSANTAFSLMTSRNIKVIVANSKDAKVAAALTPLLQSTSTVTLAGTHAPGSVNLTVTSVNGAAL